jgi:transposase
MDETGKSGGVEVAGDGESASTPRLNMPNRAQMELRPVDLEGLLPADHSARAVWAFVESLDLSALHGAIRSVEGSAGRPATDPRIFMALWLYATVEGVGSARAIERLTEVHDAYRWICGGVSVNHHSLSDFRVRHVELLDRVLTQSVAVLMNQGLVDLKRVSQDGIRVRASAGAASFRRKDALEKCLQAAKTQVRRLREELEQDPEASSRRQVAARQRAATDREKRVQRALELMPKAESKKSADKRDQARVSTTDPEANVMKMADGGFRPAYNAQFAVDTGSQIVTGVMVSTLGSDQGRLTPMLEQHLGRFGRVPAEGLVDGGFVSLSEFDLAAEQGTRVYAPPTKPRDAARDPFQPLPTDSPAIAEWRMRMGTAEAKEIYKQRASTSECVNALARNRGLQRFLVRGQDKVHSVLLWYAIAHNVMRALSLGAATGVTSAG